MVTSTFSYFPGVPIFHSKDLVNWKQVGYVLNRESQLPLLKQKTSGGIFAPAINYNPKNKTYYMITTNVGAGNFFVKTKDPFGEWSEPIWLPDVKGIDPSFFFDDNGKAYILNNDAPEGTAMYDGHRAIWIREFDVETEKTVGPQKVLINGGIHFEEKPIWIEGPHMYKINGKYFLMDAEGGTGPNHSEVILVGTDPMGEFKAWDKNPILTQRHLDPNRKDPITCAGHADLVKTKEGDWWAVFLACRPIDGKFENLGRETFLMPVRWSEDGFPIITQGNELVPLTVAKKDVVVSPETRQGNFEYTENFDEKTLSLDWLTLRTSAKDLYSLTAKPGSLSLFAGETNTSEAQTPAYICKRMQHHKFETSTVMDFVPTDNKSEAGILLYKDEFHQYFLCISKEGAQRKLCLKKISKTGSEVLATQGIAKTKPVGLKVVSRGTQYDFYYSLKKGKWNLLIKDVDANYLSTATAGGFTGSTIGMYATQNPK
jgi:alpha-N-arabinofuranosidase